MYAHIAQQQKKINRDSKSFRVVVVVLCTGKEREREREQMAEMGLFGMNQPSSFKEMEKWTEWKPLPMEKYTELYDIAYKNHTVGRYYELFRSRLFGKSIMVNDTQLCADSASEQRMRDRFAEQLTEQIGLMHRVLLAYGWVCMTWDYDKHNGARPAMIDPRPSSGNKFEFRYKKITEFQIRPVSSGIGTMPVLMPTSTATKNAMPILTDSGKLDGFSFRSPMVCVFFDSYPDPDGNPTSLLSSLLDQYRYVQRLKDNYEKALAANLDRPVYQTHDGPKPNLLQLDASQIANSILPPCPSGSDSSGGGLRSRTSTSQNVLNETARAIALARATMQNRAASNNKGGPQEPNRAFTELIPLPPGDHIESPDVPVLPPNPQPGENLNYYRNRSGL